jgi:tetratricopeptide (TPR) repeat protein
LNRRDRRAAARESKKAAKSPVTAASKRREADDFCRLGNAQEHEGRHQEAFEAFDRAVQLNPGQAEFWKRRADQCAKLNHPVDAVASYERALKLDPRYADAAFGCGVVLLKQRRLEQALSYFNLSDQLQPNHARVLEQRITALLYLGRFEEALVDGRRAHAFDPANPDICNNIGVSLHKLSRDEEALPWFDKAAALRPDFLAALNNKAMSLAQTLRIDEAFTIFEYVKTIDPNNADAETNSSHLHLLTGNYEAGWAGVNAVWKKLRDIYYPDFSQPMWHGDREIDGKTILVYSNEGAGDAIQFARYIPMLSARGARAVLVVADPLYPLLSTLPGVSQCLPKSVPSLPAFDLHCPLTTLPHAFATRLETIPSASPYLPPPAEARRRAWRNWLQSHLGPRRKLRVGLVWSGNPRHPNDHNRSIPLQLLLDALDGDADVVSLQKDARPEDGVLLRQAGILDPTSALTDFAETAALVSCLELVISVDTSVAHLAGALGQPIWILLPFLPDWRWLLDRDDSPWYPTARLFRQTAKRDWAGVVARVRHEMAARIAAFGSH